MVYPTNVLPSLFVASGVSLRWETWNHGPTVFAVPGDQLPLRAIDLTELVFACQSFFPNPFRLGTGYEFYPSGFFVYGLRYR